MDDIREDLVARLLDQLAEMRVTRDEAPLADAVERRERGLGLPVTRVGDSLVVGAPSDDRPVVALVGHLDVVPPTEDDETPGRETRTSGEVVVGRGASDMKGGNVVAMSLVEDAALRDASPYQVVLVLYAREEGPADENELTRVLDEVDWLTRAELAVILEPTDGEIQAGCVGGLHAVLTFRGHQAHSARPWHGENALTKAGAFLAELHELAPRPVDVGGITYHDVFSATQAWTDNARNVIPGRFIVNLNFRFAPTRDLAAAEQELRVLVDDRASIAIVDRAPPAPPSLDSPLVERFVAAVRAPVSAKQAWTDVARFAERGVPAVNYGPGLGGQAHQRGEYVPVDALVRAHDRLHRFLRGD